MTQYGFFFDQSRCDNCHTCVVACRDWYDIKPGPVKLIRILQQDLGVFPNARLNVVPGMCFHCENPVCIDACENHALFKEDEFGAVLLDTDLCQGKRDCWVACPYGAIQYADDAAGTPAQKCTMCYDRLLRGEIPICVASCEQRAFDFGPIDELREKYGDIVALPNMPSGVNEKPAVVFKPADEQEQLVPYDGDEVIRLMQKRNGAFLDDVYSDPSDVTEIEDGLVGHAKLVMKAGSVAENLALSKNEDG